MNVPGDNLLCLNRILDGENKKQIEFEADISGFKDIIKKEVLDPLSEMERKILKKAVAFFGKESS